MAMQREANAALHRDLAAAHADLASGAFALDTLREQTLPAARAAFDAARDGFEKGTTDYLNVLDAERTLVDVERHLIDARERYHRSAATLEGLITTPLEDAAR
jgi:cobalt-zinc-cadmium efflux system outer membrane protein